MKISVCIIAKNNEDCIENALKSVEKADEIIVLDTGSTDNTCKISRKYTDKVFENEYKWKDNFAEARNYCQKKATGDYILVLDTDEIIESTAIDELRFFTGTVLNLKVISQRTDQIHYQPRFYKNDPEIYWERPIHNYLNTSADSTCELIIWYGRSKQHDRDPGRTIRILSNWIKNNPDDCTRELYYYGVELRAKNKFKESIKIFNEYVQKSNYDAEKADAMLQISRCYISLNDHQNAVNYCFGALNINPNFTEALNLIGDLSNDRNRNIWKYFASKSVNTNVLFIRKDKRKKITILSKYDYAGSGYKIAKSVKKADKKMEIDVESFVKFPGQGTTAFHIQTGPDIDTIGKDAIQQRINESDIIHFKGDWPYKDDFEGLYIPPGKKIIYTVGGGFFRRPSLNYGREVALAKYPLSDYKADLLTALTPELCYTDDWKYMPFPCNKFDYKWKKRDKFLIVHTPSSPNRKGTDIVMDAIKLLNRKDIEFICENNIPFHKSLALKQMASIYIDQLLLPVYGNSAVEAMSFGIPVINWLTDYFQESPIKSPLKRTAESLASLIDDMCDWEYLNKLSKETFKYVKKKHGSVGESWLFIYKNL